MADITTGLITRWKLGDGSRTDLSGSGNTGVFKGGVTPLYAFGPMSNGATFDGSTGYVIGTQVVNIANISLCCWVKTSQVGSSVPVQIGGFTDGVNSATYDKTITFVPNTGVLSWYIFAGATKTISASASINNGAWRHVVATYDGANQLLYVDGAQVASGTASGSTFTGYTVPNIILAAGSGGANYNALAGSVDDFRVYNRALSSGDVAALYALRVLNTVSTQSALEQFLTTAAPAQVTQVAFEQWATTATISGQAMVTQVALEQWALADAAVIPPSSSNAQARVMVMA